MLSVHIGVLYMLWLVPSTVFDFIEGLTSGQAVAAQVLVGAALMACIFFFWSSLVFWAGLAACLALYVVLAKLCGGGGDGGATAYRHRHAPADGQGPEVRDPRPLARACRTRGLTPVLRATVVTVLSPPPE